MSLEDHLRKAHVEKPLIAGIMGVAYTRDEDPYQDAANFHAAAMRECEALLSFDTLSAVMYDRACCKRGFRLDNARELAREHGGKPLTEKLALLGGLKYMGSPKLNADGDIETVAVGAPGQPAMTCPCWQLMGRTPEGGPMPLSYCLCCAGHFRCHYQRALGLKLRVKHVLSSILNSGGELPCVFVFEIVPGK